MKLESTIEWVDLRPADVRSAREFLASVSDEGQRDELGFLALQGVFADRFYPATTTQMSIARYFFLLPRVYERVEALGLHGQAARDAARRLQHELRRILEKNGGPSLRTVEAKVLPSDVYWTSLAELGISTCDDTERTYTEALARRGAREVDDEGNPLEVAPAPLWDRKRPRTEIFTDAGKLREDIKPRLTPGEARNLLTRYASKQCDEVDDGGEKPNMVCHLVALGSTDFAHVWDIPKSPAHLRPWITHARKLSLFARGVRLQYEWMLLVARRSKRKKREESAIRATREAFADWWDVAQSESLKCWDVDAFLKLDGIESLVAKREGAPAAESTFFGRWLSRFGVAGTARELLRDRVAMLEVHERERRCKGVRARLDNDEQLYAWAPQAGGSRVYGLDYRHGVGSRIARDIVDGLGVKG